MYSNNQVNMNNRNNMNLDFNILFCTYLRLFPTVFILYYIMLFSYTIPVYYLKKKKKYIKF